MKFIKLMSMIAAVLLPAAAARAAAAPQVGDIYEIVKIRHSEEHGGLGSSGSTNDKDTITEKVTGVRGDGLELEYDLPKTVTAAERATNWQFPVRVFKPVGGPVQLLNRAELEGRVDGWLKLGGLTRAACGHWIFTWNAFRIECDPDSAIKTIESFDLGPTGLREGASYKDAEARGPGKLALVRAGADGAVFTVELPVDPDGVRRARAESDVVVGQIMRKPVIPEEALRKREGEVVSGKISIRLETDASGVVRRRTKETKMDIKGSDGQSETKTVTETLERRRMPRGG